jgi:hypothetical protein
MLVYISSKDRQKNEGYASFTCNLNIDKSFKKLTLLSAAIPLTNYVINSNCNTFSIQETSSSGTIYPITIPPGNYSSITLPPALVTAISTASGHTYTVTYSSTTNALTFSYSTVFSIIVPTPTPNIGGRNIRDFLGLSSGATTFSTSVSSTQAVILSPDLFAFISIGGVPNCFGSGQQQGSFPILLSGISNSISPFTNNSYYTLESSHAITQRQFVVSLLQAGGGLVPLMSDWSFCLKLE